jgi:2-hydroxy-3-keto-5-methylthiopentenyl-1-phosphate phosphatase
MRPFIVVCDFDGTATVEDVTNIIWDTHLDYDWRATLVPPSREGRWTALEMIARGYAGVRAGAEQLLAEVRPRVRLREGWAELVALCDERRWPLEVLSHGLRFYIREILPPGVAITCFEGTLDGDGGWRVSLPAGMSLAPGEDFKTRVVADLKARHPDHATAYVGDGRLDFPAASRCDRVYAVRGSALAVHCRKANVPFVEFDTFAEVVAGLIE